MLVSKEFKKNIIITGGGGLLGLEYIKFFLKTKSNIFILDKIINSSLKKLKKNHRHLYLYECDITKEKDVKKAFDLIKKFGSVDILINNAAIDATPTSNEKYTKLFENYDVEVWDEMMSVNLKGVFLCCKIFGK